MKRHTVIVTGATKGLGRQIALAFARAGHRVIGLYAADEAAGKQLELDLEQLGASSVVIRYDVAVENDTFWSRREIEEAQSLVLINNAWAPFTPKPFHLLRWEDVESGLKVGLKGSWLCSKAVLSPMIRVGGGTIVNVLTNALERPTKGFAGYLAGKYALRGLTVSLASEYGQRGIRVFSVSPGFMATSLTAAWDARLFEAVRASSTTAEPAAVAQRVLELVEAPPRGGQGEDYPV